MSDTQNPSSERVCFSYAGVSSVRTDISGERQQILMTTPSEHATAKATVRLKDAVAFREAFQTFYQLIQRSYHYRASSTDTNIRYNEWRPALKEAAAGEARRLFYNFLRDEDPNAESILDPLVSITPDGIIFEALSDDGRVYAALELSKDAYIEKSATYGTTFCDMGSDTFQGTQLLREMDDGTDLVIGAEGEALEKAFTAEIEKNLNISDLWFRSALQLQATLTLPTRKFSLSRMDLYSMLRHLRLNKTKRSDNKAIRFTLVPKMQPEIVLEPWEWRHTCTSDPYDGQNSEVVRVWERKDLSTFDPLLPYIDRIDVHTCGEAQPTFWIVRCGAMTLTLGSSGFHSKNWPRGLLLDIDLPRSAKAPSENAKKVLDALAEDGSRCTVTELAEQTGLDSAEVKSSLRHLSQNGEVVFDIAHDGYRKRPIVFVRDRIESLLYRNEREKRAHELVEAGKVSAKGKWLRSGDVEVTSSIEDEAYNNAIYEPFFVIKSQGQLRKPRCTCSFSLNPEHKDLTCEHIMALWIQHQIVAKNQDPNQLEVDHSTLIKRKGDEDDVHEVSLKHRRLEEVWGEKGKQRRSILLFSSVEGARKAYLKRVKHLKLYGYLDASGS